MTPNMLILQANADSPVLAGVNLIGTSSFQGQRSLDGQGREYDRGAVAAPSGRRRSSWAIRPSDQVRSALTMDT